MSMDEIEIHQKVAPPEKNNIVFFGPESTKKLLNELLEDHFEKAQKDGGEFIVSNCKECKSSEKPLFLLPTSTGNRLRDYEERKHFYSSLTTECEKHFHVPKEKEKKNGGDEESYMLPPELAEYFSEEKNRAMILKFEDQSSEDECESATGPFDYSLDEMCLSSLSTEK